MTAGGGSPQAPRSPGPPWCVRPCGTACSMAERMPRSESGRSVATRLVETASIPQPMSTPTAAGTIAPRVAITEPTVAPMPRCTSGIAATWRNTNGRRAMFRSWASALSSTGTSPCGEVVQSLIGVLPSISTRMTRAPLRLTPVSPDRAAATRPCPSSGPRATPTRVTIPVMATVERVALGLRAHSGWAVLVALGGPPASPVVVDRRRLALCDDSFPRQPYHAAENLAAAKAQALVGRSLETAHRLAREALASAVADRRAAGQDDGGRRPAPRLRPAAPRRARGDPRLPPAHPHGGGRDVPRGAARGVRARGYRGRRLARARASRPRPRRG